MVERQVSRLSKTTSLLVIREMNQCPDDDNADSYQKVRLLSVQRSDVATTPRSFIQFLRYILILSTNLRPHFRNTVLPFTSRANCLYIFRFSQIIYMFCPSPPLSNQPIIVKREAPHHLPSTSCHFLSLDTHIPLRIPL